MPKTLREKNIENIERLIAIAEDMAAAQQAIVKKHAWLAARDHLLYAAACLNRDVPQYDRAGAHIKAAHEIMAREVQA